MATITSMDQLDGSPHANAFPRKEPKTIRLKLEAGESVAPHSHPDRNVVLYLISGTLELALDEETYRLEPGDIARFDGAQDISPTAKRDSSALIVLASKSEKMDVEE